jgi:hypothetical protein
MEVMITLILRLYTLSIYKEHGKSLLSQARRITLDWIVRLRIEVRNSKETSVAESTAKYAF